MRKLLIGLLLAFCLVQCDDENEKVVNEGDIDPELKIYVDRFIEEAQLRGVELSKENLDVLLVDEFSQDFGTSFFCGYGWWNYERTGERRVEIRNSAGCWTVRPDIEKENLMFHELGHALLSRPHIADRFPNGYPSTIMCSSEGDNCDNFTVYYQSPEMRSYYLDELFGVRSSSNPEWVSKGKFVRNIFLDEIGSDIDAWESFTIGDDDNLSEYEFYIDSTGIFPSNSLAVSTGENVVQGSYTIILNRFEINDFSDCSTINAKARIKGENLQEGRVGMAVSLRKYDENGFLYRFGIHEIYENIARDLEETILETEIYCVPAQRTVVTISFTLEPGVSSRLFIDEVELDLFE